MLFHVQFLFVGFLRRKMNKRAGLCFAYLISVDFFLVVQMTPTLLVPWTRLIQSYTKYDVYHISKPLQSTFHHIHLRIIYKLAIEIVLIPSTFLNNVSLKIHACGFNLTISVKECSRTELFAYCGRLKLICPFIENRSRTHSYRLSLCFVPKYLPQNGIEVYSLSKINTTPTSLR